jgi:DNA-binding MarR family transcriptional regulator
MAVKGATRKRPVSSPEEQALLDLVRTTDLLSQRPAELIKGEDLSRTQYNVLRILRGASDGLSCGEIAERMITKDPDITRLLDRLEKRLLISRSREPRDRRTVVTRITSTGLEMLARLDEPLQSTLRDLLGHLGQKRLAELRNLLTACREGLA